MKILIVILLYVAGCVACASEPGFVSTYQPLGGMAGSSFRIAQVTCISKYAFSDDSGMVAMSLIHRPFHPPTDTGGKSLDCNLASRVGLKFSVDWTLPDQPKFVLDASNVATETKALEVAGLKREMVIMASLECLRRCTPRKLINVEVILIAKDDDKPNMEEIVRNYNKHNKDSPFFGNGS